ncbi:MAG: hypothetical protein FWC41_03530 [Firmicutes bacterium]|nr:hypothetical protein [Bacillota bacterium]
MIKLSTAKTVKTILDGIASPPIPNANVLRKLFGKKSSALTLLLKASSKFKKGGFYLNMGVLMDEYRKLKLDIMVEEVINSQKELNTYDLKIVQNVRNILELSEKLAPDLEANFKLKTELAKYDSSRSFDVRDVALTAGIIARPFAGIGYFVLAIRDHIMSNKIKRKNQEELNKIEAFEKHYKEYKVAYEQKFGKNKWIINRIDFKKLEKFLIKCKEKAIKYKEAKLKNDKTFIGRLSKYLNNNRALDELKMRFCQILILLEEMAVWGTIR